MTPDNNDDAATGIEIAVVGLAGRFPDAPDVDTFWRNIRDGVESVDRFTDDTLRARGIDAATLADPAYVKAGVRFDGFGRFDAGFFGYTPREAEQLDPQQRHFLECAWEAMEHAGYDSGRVPGAVGVYAGAGANLYLLRHLLPRVGAAGGIAELIGLMNGNAADALCTRVAYKLDLRGPAVTVQTACSTSLTAVHTACQALLSHECDMALAGGVWLNLLQDGGYRHQPGAILSSDGHCRAFDARADGTVLGSGAGVVVLKRLDEALRDGDTVHAVILVTAANNDGADKVGYTAPSVAGQADVVRAAHTIAGIDPASIGYVEAHGTGTTLGDPIEIAALAQAFGAVEGTCAIGSVKTNIGHLDAAAGIAGLIKTVMALRHRTLPPSLHFSEPNPRIDFANSPFRVNTVARVWPAGTSPRRAGVSSFGMGGTNVHVVLQEAPAPATVPMGNDSAAVLLPLSARTATALDAQATRLADHLVSQPAVPLSDVSHTLSTGRRPFAHRAVVIARDPASAAAALRGQAPQAFVSGRVLSDAPTTAFLFPGQGAQHVNMARALYERAPAFRAPVDECSVALASRIGVDLRDLIYPAPGGEAAAAARLAQTAVTQPALFTIEYALARWWMARGVSPDAMLGHSIGEYVAACVAGVFSLDDALSLVAVRGRLMQASAPGAMLSVALPEAEIQPWLAAGCDLAAVNAARQCVLSGSVAAIAAAERDLSAAGAVARRLEASHGFHSALLDPLLPAFAEEVRRVTLNAPRIPFVSNVTGRWIQADEARDPGYWVRHLRGTVRFADGVATLLEKPDRIALEVGPGETLRSLARQHPSAGAVRPVLSTLAHPGRAGASDGQPDRCTAALWAAGVAVDPAVFGSGRRVPLPTYPFERESYWVDAAAPAAPALGRPLDDWFHVPVWKRAEPLSALVAPPGGGCLLILGGDAAFADALAAAAGAPVVRVTAGAAHRRVDAGHHVLRPAHRGDHVKLLQDVAADHGTVTRIVHLWTLGHDDDVRSRGFLSLVALGQALENAGRVAIAVVTDGLEDVLGDEPLVTDKALLRGPCLVMSQELPHVVCRLVDVGRRPDAPAATAVLAALASGDEATFTACRAGHRWVRTHEAVQRTAPPAGHWRDNAVVLVTGGLGGVGLTLAEHLARRGPVRLVLLGRTPVADDDTRLQALRSLGAEVLAVDADVADAEAVHAAVARARVRFGRIHAVIHAAGVEGGAMLGDLTADLAAAVLRPKVEGTRVLLDALAGEPLDHVVLCSSLAAVAGGPGKAAYAAANACLDAVAAAARRSSPVPVFSIAWDGWRDVGMARGLQMPDGVGIDPASGVLAYDRIVMGPAVPETVVCTTLLALRTGRLDLAQAGLVPARRGDKHPRPAQFAGTFVEPEGEVELALAEVWSDLLGLAPIGSADDLFEMGGDSLLAIQVISRVRSRFGADLSVKAVFDAPTPAAFARVLAARKQQATPSTGFTIEPGVSGHVPLSYAQQRLWFLWQLEPHSAAFSITAAFHLRGALDLDGVRRAFAQLVARHAVLRTVFEDHDGQATQVVRADTGIPVTVVDLAGTPSEVEAHVARRSREPFDLGQGPLLRPEVIRLAPGHHVLLLVMHHLVTDGWSIAVMMDEFVRTYGGAEPLPPPRYQYADFAVAQRCWLEAGEMQRQSAYWKGRLDGVAPLVLPADLPAPAARTYPGGLLAFSLGAERTAGVRACARQAAATPFMVLLAALSMVLSERSGQQVFHLGTDMANRNRPETESLVGFFVNQVALPIDCATPGSMGALLAQLQRTVLDATDHQDLPFDRLVEALRAGPRGGRAPLFRVKVIYQDDNLVSFTLPGLAVAPYPLPCGEAELDLIVSFLASADDIRVEVKYDRELYADATLEAVREELLAALAAVVADPAVSLTTLRTTLQSLRRAAQSRSERERAQRLAERRTGLKPRAASASS
ncbi:type I polyketide synthase [Rhizobacter sp. Root1221]|uniref:type I polyketide synthase n=1 Tax=Rhizobacter sp. Root1221 TaxID=1736433 RepID=UPI0009EC86F4|nr:type I polyketide synthase [Rhizobacter sp. Root1221]